MAESISEGTLKTWLKQVGDSVEADEEVATIETDKVSLCFSATVGTLSARRVFHVVLVKAACHVLTVFLNKLMLSETYGSG